MPSGSSSRSKTTAFVPFAFIVFGVSAGFAACTDAIHLDPPGAAASSGTGGSVVHVDAGKDAPLPVTCRSNPDCAYPKPVCDTVADMCVECLVISDCAGRAGTVCSQGECKCPSPDGSPSLLTFCAGETPACVDTTVSVTNCGACGTECFTCTNGKCGPWSPITTVNAPEARSHHVSVWTGSQMFVWGGKDGTVALDSGGLYDPVAKTWTPTSSMNAPSARWDATAIWDDVDNLVVVWGGTTGGNMGGRQDGGVYDPAKDVWKPISTAGAPSARVGHSAVWAKVLKGFGATPTSGMMVWGGLGNGATQPYLGDGAAYNPAQDMWLGVVDATGAPSPRAYHVATWDSGNRMVVFGGLASAGTPPVATTLGDVLTYDPSLNMMGTTTWTTLTMGSPAKRYDATGIYEPASKTTLVWGGYDGTSYLTDGAQLSGTTWSTLGSGGSMPEGRRGQSAVILAATGGSQLAIFGGDEGASNILDKGWTLNVTGNAWSALPTPGPSARTHHTAVANGASMLVWGGDTAAGPTNTGAVYTAP